jgi:hypothetical protein
MGGFWPRIYVVKKGHARDTYFLLQTRNDVSQLKEQKTRVRPPPTPTPTHTHPTPLR